METPHHLASLRTPFLLFSHFKFWLPILLIDHKLGRAPILIENVNFDELIVISVKNASERGRETVRFKEKVVQTGPPYVDSEAANVLHL